MDRNFVFVWVCISVFLFSCEQGISNKKKLKSEPKIVKFETENDTKYFKTLNKTNLPENVDKNANKVDKKDKIKSIIFKKNPNYDEKVTLTAVGDIMVHSKIFYYGDKNPEGFGAIFKNIKKHIKGSDIGFCNFEAPVSSGHRPIGFPIFNAPKAYLMGVKETGFNLISIANNHILDVGPDGLFNTIKVMKKLKLTYIGAGMKDEPLLVIKTIKGVKFGFAAFTYKTNRFPKKEYFQDKWINIAKFEDKKWIRKNIEVMKEWKKKVDFLVVSVHWGVEMGDKSTYKQEFLAYLWLEAGVDVLLGHHPHTIMTGNIHHAKDGRKAVVLYSMGNFFSNMGIGNNNERDEKIHPRAKCSDGMIAFVDFYKNREKKNQIEFSYRPTYTYKKDSKKYIRTFKVLDIVEEIAKLEKEKKCNLRSKDNLCRTLKVRLKYITKMLKSFQIRPI
jgi:poly-gamma-glutamate capsule biosynthesis protein CapA/YwtB (metallophosphatase superfamily)